MAKIEQTQTKQIQTKQISPLFLYIKGTAVSPETLKKVEDAGYLAIEVNDFSDVRIVEYERIVTGSPIAIAALRTIMEASHKGTLQGSFGAQVASILIKSAEKY